MKKTDERVQMPASRHDEDSCKLKIVHDTAPKYDPEVLNLIKFPASCHICKCSAASLYLKCKDISENDYSKQLCNLLSMEKSKLYIELDGLTMKALSRVGTMVTSAKKMFDQRLTIILFSEKTVKEESIKRIVDKEIQFKEESSESNSKRSRQESPSIKSKTDIRTDSSEIIDSELERLRSEVVEIKEMHKSESTLSKNEIDDLKEENEKLLSSQAKAKIELDNLESSIISMKEQHDNLKEEMKEFTANNKDLSNRHQDVKKKLEDITNINENINAEKKSLNNKLMEATNEHHSLHGKYVELSGEHNDLKQMYAEIIASHKTLELKNEESSKLANEMLQERNSILSKLEHSESRVSNLVDALKMKEAECKESSSEKVIVEPLSVKDEEESTIRGSEVDVSSLQAEVQRVQALHPMAGPCEIVNRSIEGFSSQNDYVFNSGAYECNVIVKSPASLLLKFPSLSYFKGIGKSKKLAKANAFETVLKKLKKSV